MQQGEKDATCRSNHGPTESARFITSFGSAYTKEHGQTAGQQDESHYGNIHYAVKWFGPVGGAVAQKTIGDQACCKGGRIGDDKQPDGHFFCRNRKWRQPRYHPRRVSHGHIGLAHRASCRMVRVSSTTTTADR